MIIRNAIKCRKCGEVIESISSHDFKTCSAPSLDDFIDLSVVELEEPSDTLFFS